MLRLPRLHHSFSCVGLCTTILSVWFFAQSPPVWNAAPAVAAALDDAAIDRRMQDAATAALGTREGTIIIMDAQTGRLRAVVNERIAYAASLPPGSTVKPFTLLAALRAGLIDDDSRLLCRNVFKHDDFEIHCSHPRFKPPFNPAQALAHSCNYYFSTLGQRFDAKTFNTALASFGFGSRSGVTSEAEEVAGILPRKDWRTRNALGEGHELLVTPVQLITAYAALANGGHLLHPHRAAAHDDDTTRDVRRRIDISAAHRRLIVEGMRGAVAYGTAARAGLDSLPAYVIGKTGTSTTEDALSNDGWFVGLASEPGDGDDASPEHVRLAVLVFLKRANGAECAELARPILETYTRAQEARAGTLRPTDDGATADTSDAAQASSPSTPASPSASSATRVRVRVQGMGEGRTMSMPLEQYIFGVVAAEASIEDEPEALKAQAVVSRTFALKNKARHQREGYDFCSSTHCQRFVAVRDEGVRPEFYSAVHRAIGETVGEILRDAGGGVADAYFSAACGGTTANIKTLWGEANAPAHLRGVSDPFCAGMPYRNWTDTITVERLADALRNDPRTHPGRHLDGVRVLRRDSTGRVETLLVEGERRRVVRGWDFKIIVGRTLGWSVLKSSRFDVVRAGNAFRFRGSGFGHGLGLCQLGAHTMARRGASYRRILNQYLPGTTVGAGASRQLHASLADAPSAWTPHASPHAPVRFQTTGFQPADDTRDVIYTTASTTPRGLQASASMMPPLQRRRAATRLVLAGEGVRVNYPSSVARRDVEICLRILEAARADVRRRLQAASLDTEHAAATVDVFIHETTGDFAGATGEPAWVAATTRGRRIEMQPPAVLRRRAVFDTTLRHEYVHVVVEALGRGRAPRWLAEGLAVHVAGESRLLARADDGAASNFSRDELERRLVRPASAQEMRALYRAAHREVSRIIGSEGERGAWLRVARG